MKKIIFIVAFLLLLAAPIANAAGLVPCGGVNEKSCDAGQFSVLLQNIFDFLITISIPLATLAIIYGAVLLLTSSGSAGRIEQGKKAIMAALIGLAIVFGSWFIYKAVFNAITGQSMFSFTNHALAVGSSQNPFDTGGSGSTPQCPPDGSSGSLIICPPPGIPTDVTQLITNITKWLLSIVGGIVALMILYGAFQILTAGGSPERYESGKKTILYAIIGLAIVILSSGIVQIIKQLLGAK